VTTWQECRGRRKHAQHVLKLGTRTQIYKLCVTNSRAIMPVIFKLVKNCILFSTQVLRKRTPDNTVGSTSRQASGFVVFCPSRPRCYLLTISSTFSTEIWSMQPPTCIPATLPWNKIYMNRTVSLPMSYSNWKSMMLMCAVMHHSISQKLQAIGTSRIAPPCRQTLRLSWAWTRNANQTTLVLTRFFRDMMNITYTGWCQAFWEWTSKTRVQIRHSLKTCCCVTFCKSCLKIFHATNNFMYRIGIWCTFLLSCIGMEKEYSRYLTTTSTWTISHTISYTTWKSTLLTSRSARAVI